MKKYILLYVLFSLIFAESQVIEGWYNIRRQDNNKKIGYVHHRMVIFGDRIEQNEDVYIYRSAYNKYILLVAARETMERDLQMRVKQVIRYREGKKTTTKTVVQGNVVKFFENGKLVHEREKPKKLYGNFGARLVKVMTKFVPKTKGKALVAQNGQVVEVTFEVLAEKSIMAEKQPFHVYPVKFSGEGFVGTTYGSDDGRDIMFEMEDPYLRWLITSKQDALSLTEVEK
ncbi:hypothetical protein [Candidatus Uabimicrobium amorphum]|uniref:Uncharacterized protein n=1 Tax=Uabimicrobium amorphum TaxID=2596890 RepID=A0A5S9F3R4_UABAM|nr:hypothetical protein [Candidatus Uabimicrobium amorphum]BBM83442.1 hypothetical protein UABAM_01794 [Candidatus Uabimicrobium amorphum]